jgi:hypothetical protein
VIRQLASDKVKSGRGAGAVYFVLSLVALILSIVSSAAPRVAHHRDLEIAIVVFLTASCKTAAVCRVRAVCLLPRLLTRCCALLLCVVAV